LYSNNEDLRISATLSIVSPHCLEAVNGRRKDTTMVRRRKDTTMARRRKDTTMTRRRKDTTSIL
jgi:hypothetical protein